MQVCLKLESSEHELSVCHVEHDLGLCFQSLVTEYVLDMRMVPGFAVRLGWSTESDSHTVIVNSASLKKNIWAYLRESSWTGLKWDQRL